MSDFASWDKDPTLYLFTSLTAGSSHIVTATSRIETILKANKIPFKGVDTATDESARKLYGRRGSGRKLPLLVKEGFVIGDLAEIEEWNEYGELKEALGFAAAPTTSTADMIKAANASSTSSASAPASASTPIQKENVVPGTPQTLAMRELSAQAAAVGASKKDRPTKIETTNPLLSEKVNTPGSATPKGDSILSPKSIPLPQTPIGSTASADKGKEKEKEKEAKDVGEETEKDTKGKQKDKATESTLKRPDGTYNMKMPPNMHTDAANPALDAGPIAVSQAPISTKSGPAESSSSEESSSEEDEEESEEEEDEDENEDEDESEDEDDDDDDDEAVTSDKGDDIGKFQGGRVRRASEADIRKIEKEQAIPEASSSEEEDSEEERKMKFSEPDDVKDKDTASSSGSMFRGTGWLTACLWGRGRD